MQAPVETPEPYLPALDRVDWSAAQYVGSDGTIYDLLSITPTNLMTLTRTELADDNRVWFKYREAPVVNPEYTAWVTAHNERQHQLAGSSKEAELALALKNVGDDLRELVNSFADDVLVGQYRNGN